MFAELRISGKDQHPLYRYLTQCLSSGLMLSNYMKFLVNQFGKPISRFYAAYSWGALGYNIKTALYYRTACLKKPEERTFREKMHYW